MVDINELIKASLQRHEKETKIWDYESERFIKFAKSQWKNLKSGITHKEPCDCLSCLYHRINKEKKGLGGRLRKFPFFESWIDYVTKDKNQYVKKDGYQTYLIDGKTYKVTPRDKVDCVLDELHERYGSKDPDFNFPRSHDGYIECGKKLFQRYKRRGIFDKRWLEIKAENKAKKYILSEEFKKTFRRTFPYKKWNQYLKLRRKILNSLKEGSKTKRELQRKVASRKNYDYIFRVLFDLTYEGLINFDPKEKRFFFISDDPGQIESQDFYNRYIPSPSRIKKPE